MLDTILYYIVTHTNIRYKLCCFFNYVECVVQKVLEIFFLFQFKHMSWASKSKNILTIRLILTYNN